VEVVATAAVRAGPGSGLEDVAKPKFLSKLLDAIGAFGGSLVSSMMEVTSFLRRSCHICRSLALLSSTSSVLPSIAADVEAWSMKYNSVPSVATATVAGSTCLSWRELYSPKISRSPSRATSSMRLCAAPFPRAKRLVPRAAADVPGGGCMSTLHEPLLMRNSPVLVSPCVTISAPLENRFRCM
jgi:hypothetical protein